MIHRRTRILGLSATLVFAALPAAQDVAADAAPEKEPVVIKVVGPKGVYADLPETGFDLASLLMGGASGQAKSFYELTRQIEELAEDDEVETVLFDLTQGIGVNLAQMAELERSLATLREDGVKCIAYLENAGRAQYAIASQCDQVLMADMGSLDLGSLAMSSTYMKDTYDLLGIQFDVVRCGDFKGAAEPYMVSRMSKHLRRQYEEMLGRMNDDVVRRIAEGRGLSKSKVREHQGKRMFSAKEALVAGLVDRLVPWEGAEASARVLLGDEGEFEFKNALKKKRKKSFNMFAFLQTMFDREEEEEAEEATLAVLHLSGPIMDGRTAMPGSIISGAAVKNIESLRDNDNVKGVVVRINSPGGSATASEAILLALKSLAETKPVVCSMGSVAASGGYYVTCFGRPIYAEAGTITGSIGVLGVKPNLGPLMRRIGMHEEIIALDESAAMDSMGSPWTDADKERMQGFVNEIYDRFLNHVAASRSMERSEVEAIAGGRVWSGDQAVARGLVDHIGGLPDALAAIAEEAEVEEYEISHLPRPRSFMDTFAEEMLEVRALLPTGLPRSVVKRLEGLVGPVAVLFDALQENPARVWALMPAELRIR